MADMLFRGTTRFFAAAVLLLLGAVMVSLLVGALPAFNAFGFGFLFQQRVESGTRGLRRRAGDLRHASSRR